MNVYDNITLGPKRVQSMSKEDMDKTVDDLLAKVGLSDKKFSYPLNCREVSSNGLP